MDRVSNNLIRNDYLYSFNKHQTEMEKVEKQISSQRKITSAEDDPVGTAEIMFQRSRLNDVDRYERNIDFSKGRLDLTEQKLQEMNTLLQRAKELSIQGANSILTKEDRQKIGVEVNQILEQAVQIANSKYKGESVFGGSNSFEEAFKVTMGKIKNPATGEIEWGESSITKVDYQGDIGGRYAEVGRGEYLSVNLPGNKAFWVNNQSIVSGTPGTDYIAKKDQILKIDGSEIQIKAGDNLRTVADKINAANINVRAEIDNTTGQNIFMLRTTTPHQMWIEDIQGGSVMQDLGMISSSVSKPPYNYSPTASVQGETVFDRLIKLRDSLYQGDTNGVNSSIGGIDESINNNLHQLAYVGSVQKRMENTDERLKMQKVYSNEVMSRLEGLDMAEALTQLKNLESEYNAALQMGAKLLPKTLLDFLR